MTRCYNTEAADKWAQEQDDNAAEQDRKREKLHLLLDGKSELIAEFLRDKFAAVISDDNDEDVSESELMDKLGDELDD